MLNLVFGFILSVFIVSLSFGHGEHKFGPNGGFIKMPGAFHTELKVDDRGILIWLLDLEFKNPLVSESALELKIFEKKNKKSIIVKCSPDKEYFLCKTPLKSNDINSVKVSAIRNNQNGIEMEYLFPLKLPEAPKHH